MYITVICGSHISLELVFYPNSDEDEEDEEEGELGRDDVAVCHSPPAQFLIGALGHCASEQVNKLASLKAALVKTHRVTDRGKV